MPREAASTELRRAIPSSDGGFGRAQYHLAIVLLRLGRAEEAVRVLQRVLRGSIQGGNLYVARAEVHELLGNAWEVVGNAWEVVGNADSAAAHYRVVLTSWQHADPEFHARREIAAHRLASLGLEKARR